MAVNIGVNMARSQSNTKDKCILCLDLSLASTGYSVIKVVGRKVEVIEIGHINNKKYSNRSHGFRLYQIFIKLRELFDTYYITDVVKERGFSKGHISTQALFKVAGVVDLIIHAKSGLEATEIAPLTVKKLVGGHGKASKEEVEAGVQKFLKSPVSFQNNDESDSLGVGIAYCLQKKLI